MLDVIEAARKHFREQLENVERTIDVPEWNTTIYLRPINCMQRDAVMKHIANGEYESAKIEAIIQRARDANGNKMFRPAHKQVLLREVDPKVIERITDEMGMLEEVMDGDGNAVEADPKKS